MVESGRHYREYKLIQGINLLTNMVKQIIEKKEKKNIDIMCDEIAKLGI